MQVQPARLRVAVRLTMHTRIALISLAAYACGCAMSATGAVQTAEAPQPPAQAAPLATPLSAQSPQAASLDPVDSTTAQSRVSMLTGDQVVQILDQTVDWYRTLGIQQQNANQPSDLLILFANRQTADKVVSLAFEIARANAELLSSEATAVRSTTGVLVYRGHYVKMRLTQPEAQVILHGAEGVTKTGGHVLPFFLGGERLAGAGSNMT